MPVNNQLQENWTGSHWHFSFYHKGELPAIRDIQNKNSSRGQYKPTWPNIPFIAIQIIIIITLDVIVGEINGLGVIINNALIYIFEQHCSPKT